MSEGNRTEGQEKRPWLAALLSLLWPGLGHAYLRAWARALLWLLLLVTTTLVMIPPSIQPSSFTADAIFEAYAQIPTTVSLVVFGLTVLCSVDAYRMAQTRNRQASPTSADGEIKVEKCPNCGKELDEDLDFCPWCSYQLVEEVDEENSET